MESGRKKYLKNFIVLIDNTLTNVIGDPQKKKAAGGEFWSISSLQLKLV